MKGNHPKRRRDKYNPYYICEIEGLYYLSFKDGQGKEHSFEISTELYHAFDEFELRDLSWLNVWDRHLEHVEIWEEVLNERAVEIPETVEDIVIRNLEAEQVHRAIMELPEVQKRRVVWHFFDGLTYEQIAGRENCSRAAVKYTIDTALKKLKKILERDLTNGV